MTDQSTNLRLPYLMPSQAQKHVTVNEAVRRLDALVQTAVESRSVSAQPGAPDDGAVWIAPAGKTGAEWGLFADNALAYYRDGAWEEIQPKEGWKAYLRDEGVTLVFDGADWVSESSAATGALSGVTSVNSGPLGGVRNGVLNGDFRVAQRGTTFNAIATNASCLDRWAVTYNGGGTRNITRETFTPGAPIGAGNGEPPYFLRWNQTAATSGATAAYLRQRIEHLSAWMGRTVTVSFWAKANAALSGCTVRLVAYAGLGTGSAASSSTAFSPTTSWQKFSVTFDLASLSGFTLASPDDSYLELRVQLPLDETFTFDITQVQLEVGAVATPFENRSYALELAACKRFFERLVAGGAYSMAAPMTCISTTVAEGSLKFVEKRVAPSFAYGGAWRLRVGSGFPSLTGLTLEASGPQLVRIQATVASGLTNGYAAMLQAANDANAYIDLIAEN